MKFLTVFIVFVMLILLGLCLREVYYASMGPDVSFRLDAHHYLKGWPGFIVQYKPDGSSDIVAVTDANSHEHYPNAISKYAITEKYIVAEAEEGWLAINRASFQIWGFYETIEELESKIGKRLGELHIVDEFSRSNVFIPPATWFALGSTIVVFMTIAIIILYVPSMYHSIRRKEIDNLNK